MLVSKVGVKLVHYVFRIPENIHSGKPQLNLPRPPEYAIHPVETQHFVCYPGNATSEQIKNDRVSLKNVLASSPRTIWVPRENCRLVAAGAGGSPVGREGKGRFSKMDASRQEALTRTLRGLSAGVRIPLAGIAGFRAAIRRRINIIRMRESRTDA